MHPGEYILAAGEIELNAGRRTARIVVRNTGDRPNHVIDPAAPSAARVVYDYYGGKKAFPAEWDAMMVAVDKADSAQFSREEILQPTGWVLLNYLMELAARSRNVRVENPATRSAA